MTDTSALIATKLKEMGPLLGKEIALAVRGHPYLALWQACFSDPQFQLSFFSRYYLRYDITREDQVRLSPSILRDFLSFTLVSLAGQRDQVIERQAVLSNAHREISMWKIGIASEILKSVLATVPRDRHDRLCAFVAGDLTYFLGHNEPREVASVGEMVSGSDIDIVIVHDGLEDEHAAAIDAGVARHKSYYLRHPDYRQEVDYVVKSRATMFEQLHYSDIHEKIASKIAYESLFIAGSVELYGSIKDRMASSGVNRLIELDFEHGLEDRKRAMRTLLLADTASIDRETESLFFFSQERVEFA